MSILGNSIYREMFQRLFCITVVFILVKGMEFAFRLLLLVVDDEQGDLALLVQMLISPLQVRMHIAAASRAAWVSLARVPQGPLTAVAFGLGPRWWDTCCCCFGRGGTGEDASAKLYAAPYSGTCWVARDLTPHPRGHGGRDGCHCPASDTIGSIGRF